jgi:Transglycosylase SLT domain
MKRLLLLGFLAVVLTGDVSTTSADNRNLIIAAAERHGVPIALALRVAEVESQCDCFARGSHGELGPLQIKPATAKLIGYQGPEGPLQSCNEGLEWGMKHLSLALRRGGVWKHNQGLWAKQRNTNGIKYERTVFAVYIASKLLQRKETLLRLRVERSPKQQARASASLQMSGRI